MNGTPFKTLLKKYYAVQKMRSTNMKKSQKIVQQFLRGKSRVIVPSLVGMLMAGSISSAEAYEFPAWKKNITQSDWADAETKATNDGTNTIIFPDTKDVIHIEPITVNKSSLTIAGHGSWTTQVVCDKYTTDVAEAIFKIKANNVVFKGLTISGDIIPERDSLFTDGGFISVTGGTVVKGVRYGIYVVKNSNGEDPVNLQVKNAFISKVHDGIRFNKGVYPHGLRVVNVDVACTANMVIGSVRQKETTPEFSVSKNFIVRDLRLVNFERKVSEEDREPSVRGVVMDMGNDKTLTNLDPVNYKGSYIEDCNIMQVAAWQIGFTRGSNITIRRNTFGGGGYMSNSLQQALHFEDAGDRDNPITITGNKIHQKDSKLWHTSQYPHIWCSRVDSEKGVALKIAGNTYSGLSNKLVLYKNNSGNYTVGSDVADDQKWTRLNDTDNRNGE